MDHQALSNKEEAEAIEEDLPKEEMILRARKIVLINSKNHWDKKFLPIILTIMRAKQMKENYHH